MGKRSAFERRRRRRLPDTDRSRAAVNPAPAGRAQLRRAVRGRWRARTPSRILRPVLHLCRRHHDRTGRACLRQLRRSSDHHQSALEARPATCVDPLISCAVHRSVGCCSTRTGRTPANPETSSNTAPASSRSGVCAGFRVRLTLARTTPAGIGSNKRTRSGPLLLPFRCDNGTNQTRPCEQCGTPYKVLRADTRFCSNACRQRAYRDRIAVTVSVTEDARLGGP